MGSIPSYDLDRRIAPYLLWNANLSKKITDRMSVTLFVNNVFDKIHPRDDSYADYPYFYWTYSPIGREVGAQLAYRFQ
jgi:outer membrane receptor protein involved in Fe transport